MTAEQRAAVVIPAAIAVGLLGACDGRAAPSFAESVHLSESDSAYVISSVDARLGGLGDERVVFGSILDVDRTASGWVAVDGLVFTTPVGEHYLLRASGDDRWPVAPIPPDFRLGARGRGSFTSNLVAVTPDGTVHVLDGRHLALVSYSQDGAAARVAFLPREMREEQLKELTTAEDGTWQYELMGVRMVNKVDPLADGSLFLSVRHGTAVGYVVDTESLTATPIVIGDDWHGLRERNAQYFDGRRLVLDGGLTPELVLITTELVPLSIAVGGGK